MWSRIRGDEHESLGRSRGWEFWCREEWRSINHINDNYQAPNVPDATKTETHSTWYLS